MWLIKVKKYMDLIDPLPLKGTGSLVNLDTTYETKNIEDNINAVIIDILWAFVFLFFTSINPVTRSIAVDPFRIAWKNGKELKSILPVSIDRVFGKIINKATAIGIIIESDIINGIKNESFFFILT